MKKQKNDIVPAVEVSQHWQDIAEKSLAANERWTTAKSVATLLRAATGKPTHLFTDEDCPFHWADYPEGYIVFHTTTDIFTREHPVAVYYKGSTSSAALKAARKMLTKAGYACEPPSRGSSTRPSKVVATRKPVAIGRVV